MPIRSYLGYQINCQVPQCLFKLALLYLTTALKHKSKDASNSGPGVHKGDTTN